MQHPQQSGHNDGSLSFAKGPYSSALAVENGLGVLANFMDSSLLGLERKGNLSSVPDLYNPQKIFSEVIHYTPHAEDLRLQNYFAAWNIRIVAHGLYWPRPFALASAVTAIAKEMRRARVRIVRGRLPYLGSLLGCLAARLVGVPSVVSLGGDNRLGQIASNTFHYNSRMISFGMENLVLRLCDQIIAPNQFTKAYVRKIIGSARMESKCTVVPWRCERILEKDPRGPNVRNIFGFSHDSHIIPIIGFINRYKYSHVLFECFQRRPPVMDPPVVFVFCGDGPLRAEGEARFSGRSDIRFIGWQQRPVVHALVREAAGVLVPMSGFVLLEAASVGKPVITSLTEWHGELVEDNVSGLLVDPGDAAAWDSAIRRLTGDRDSAIRWGRELRRRFESDYSPEVTTEREISLYRRLVWS